MWISLKKLIVDNIVLHLHLCCSSRQSGEYSDDSFLHWGPLSHTVFWSKQCHMYIFHQELLTLNDMSFQLSQTPNTCFPLNYSVQLSTGTTSFTKGSFLYSGKGTEHIVLTELDENTEYTARVLAQNKDNFSSLSEEISFCEYMHEISIRLYWIICWFSDKLFG